VSEVVGSHPWVAEKCYKLVLERESFSGMTRPRRLGMLQIGIRAKVSTLILDGPYKWL
jgi:hypothetical protein